MLWLVWLAGLIDGLGLMFLLVIFGWDSAREEVVDLWIEAREAWKRKHKHTEE